MTDFVKWHRGVKTRLRVVNESEKVGLGEVQEMRNTDATHVGSRVSQNETEGMLQREMLG